jgi:hypothetical protein
MYTFDKVTVLNSEITLKLGSYIIEHAKKYAKGKHVSLCGCLKIVFHKEIIFLCHFFWYLKPVFAICKFPMRIVVS